MNANISRRFWHDERGVTAIMFALSAVALAAMVGAAFDGSRWYAARNQHAGAIDAALLSGARYLQLNQGDTTGAEASAQGYFNANIGTLGKTISSTVAFSVSSDQTQISFTGQTMMPTTFLRVVGISSLRVDKPAMAQISASGGNHGSNLEIALMLDVTGSMCDDGTGPCSSGVKIDGVKQAATDLANIVLGQSNSGTATRIALVPYASAVRIDEDGTNNPLMQVLTKLPSTWSGWQGAANCTGGSGYWQGEIYIWTSQPTCTYSANYVSNWKLIPCVTERTFPATGFDPTDSAPSAGNWLLGNGGDRFPLSWDSTDNSPFTVGNPGYSGLTKTDPTWQWDYTPDGSGCTTPQGNEILPLTPKLSDVTNRLKSLTAYGPTAGSLGVVWTQYMLSPNWSGIWTGQSTPGSYADTQSKLANGFPVLRKVAVLMTDGGFNTFREAVTDYSQDGGTFMQQVSQQAVDTCTKMKSNGIEIYTVGFNLNALSPGEQKIATATLQACGTDLAHFYSSLDAPSLDKAFKDIALKVAQVRLTQ